MYSKIDSITVKNYNCIENVMIDYNESPIICLTGDNDAGKSSVIDAFTSLIFHNNERNQKDSIRDGTNGWGCQVDLVDGTRLVKIKTKKNVQYGITYPNKESWKTDKVDAGGGAPLPVQEVMGCIREGETKEFLHVRTYRDQLLFITTSASTNYKMMYGALKAEHISKAIKNGTTELNQLDSENKKHNLVLDSLRQNLKEIKLYDLSLLRRIKERMDSRLDLLDKLERAVAIKKNLQAERSKLKAYEQFNKSDVKEVEVVVLDKLLRIQEKLKEINVYKAQLGKYKAVEVCNSIDVSFIDKLTKAHRLKEDVRTYQGQLKQYEGVKDLRSIDLENVRSLQSALVCMKELTKAREVYKKYVGLEECKVIDINYIDKLMSALDKKDSYIEYRSQLNKYKPVLDKESIEISLVERLERAKAMSSKVKEERERLKALQVDHARTQKDLESTGVKMTACGNCGHMVYVE